MELIPRPRSATEMNLQRIFECENRGADALMRESDKRREVLIAFFERTPPSTQMRGIQTNLSNIDAAAFNARQRPDLFSCPLQEPSLYFGLGLFLSRPLDLEFVQ